MERGIRAFCFGSHESKPRHNTGTRTVSRQISWRYVEENLGSHLMWFRDCSFGCCLAAAIVSIFLSSCVSTAPAVEVTSEPQAIAIAKDRCAWTRPFDATERWHAVLHEGFWHVWLVRDIDPKEPVVG